MYVRSRSLIADDLIFSIPSPRRLWKRLGIQGLPERTTLSTPDTPTRGPARPGPYIVSGILLVFAIAMPLIVPMYARQDPELFGIPFFYWYQMLWVFIDAFLLWIVYMIVTREDNRRRAAVRGLASATDAHTDQTHTDQAGEQK